MILCFSIICCLLVVCLKFLAKKLLIMNVHAELDSMTMLTHVIQKSVKKETRNRK